MAFQEQRKDFIHIDTCTQDVLYDMTKDFRPETPKHQSDFFPITPNTTPFTNRTNMQQTGYSRTADSSPTCRDPQLTIKASQAMQRGGSYQDNFATMHRRPISPLPSPPHTAPLRPRGSVDYSAFPPTSFLNMSELNLNVSAEGAGYESIECSPMTKASSNVSSYHASPEMAHMSLFGDMDTIDSDTMAARLLTLAEVPNDVDYSTETIKPQNAVNFKDPFVSDSAINAIFAVSSSPSKGHTRYDSFDSVYSDGFSQLKEFAQFGTNGGFSSVNNSPTKGHARARSQAISEADSIEEVVENTGVSVEEINSFIGGPNEQNRWTCLYEGCEKHRTGATFGRKENIKSHVQGHLKDRQFRCKVCKKTFVRQHDLKRHANIHTLKVVKACKCGKEFARADALTRHRQRGMCSGAFPDTPKKIAKRGRPKKASRPVTDERAEKAEKTRERVLERMASASISGSSAHTSPAMQALPMSRQDSTTSSQSFYSTPPELDLSSSSPLQHPNSLDHLPASLPAPLTSLDPRAFFTNDFFEKDFPLSSELSPLVDDGGHDATTGGSLQDWNFDDAKSQLQFYAEGFADPTTTTGGEMGDAMGDIGDSLNDF